jgi:hypothetical protein
MHSCLIVSYIYIYIYIYIYTHTRMYIYIYTCVCVCMYVCMYRQCMHYKCDPQTQAVSGEPRVPRGYIYTHMHTYTHTYIQACGPTLTSKAAWSYLPTGVRTVSSSGLISQNIHPHTHTYIHIRIHTCMYTHIHTYRLVGRPSRAKRPGRICQQGCQLYQVRA